MRRAAATVLGEELAALLPEDVLTLQDVGLERIDVDEVARLRERYGAFDHEGAREIMRFLDGEYLTSEQVVQEQ
jgi:hypothetical protein